VRLESHLTLLQLAQKAFFSNDNNNNNNKIHTKTPQNKAHGQYIHCNTITKKHRLNMSSTKKTKNRLR